MSAPRTRFVQWLLGNLLILCLLLGTVTYLQLGLRHQRDAEITRNCEATNRAIEADRAGWQVFEAAVADSQEGKPQTAEQKARTEAFFHSLYAKLQPIDC